MERKASSVMDSSGCSPRTVVWMIWLRILLQGLANFSAVYQVS